MRIKSNGFSTGYNSITEKDGKNSVALMDFGIIALPKGERYVCQAGLERALVLLQGEVTLSYGDSVYNLKRSNVFDESTYCLHTDKRFDITIESHSDDVQLAYQATDNEKEFDHVYYTPDMVRSEMRGKGTMNETSTRNVRTVFDDSNAPYANLVVGEVIGYPGKWSSYPPHHHPQPEIYYYKFSKPQGYGFCELGDEAIKLANDDTVIITEGLTHPQAAAPGYAIYYLWVIRHLDDNRYDMPTFVEEHKWVMDENAVIWPEK